MLDPRRQPDRIVRVARRREVGRHKSDTCQSIIDATEGTAETVRHSAARSMRAPEACVISAWRRMAISVGEAACEGRREFPET
jgi:hypothetical protein